jgi:iron complex outermembrane receptor protein
MPIGRGCIAAAHVLLLIASDAISAPAGTDRLADLSLAELSQVQVISVSKSPESLRQAAAAIYVISHDEIRRSGATSVSEALRLAPNLQITQYSASRHVAGARGFAGNEELQNFSNKLLILIDGRSVYTPLYSGVYLDVQDVLLADVDRIEVISGPGATLWGANAMNGVINIITRSAALTQGTLLAGGGGNLRRDLMARYGTHLSPGTSLRVYGKAFEVDSLEAPDGTSAQDDWRMVQGGMRLDWVDGAHTVTAQSDLYRAVLNQVPPGDVEAIGGNALARWQYRTAVSETQLQAYYDYTSRTQPFDGVGFHLRTIDLELQQSRSLGSAQHLVWGLGGRLHRYSITNSPSLAFDPDAEELSLLNLFVEDTIALTADVDLTLGLKLENDPYDSWEALPDVRLGWQATETAFFWASASRAIRSATPFDVNVIETLGTTLFLTGNRDFRPERVNAFEIGYRGQPAASLSLSMSVFYNVYDDLRTIEPAPGGQFLPLRWDNLMQGDTYGLEAWGKWQVLPRWRLSPGIRLLRKDLRFSAGASQLIGLDQSGNDPRSQALLTSSMDIADGFTLDLTLRYVDDLPDPALDSYYELNASASWQVSRHWQLQVSGTNLLDSQHREYPAPSGGLIRRGVFAEASWEF